MKPDIKQEIATELYQAIVHMKGSSTLAGFVASWGDGDSTDAEFLEFVRRWNAAERGARDAGESEQ